MTDFITKDSGARQEYASGMNRDTQDGKPRHDLINPPGMPYAELPTTRWAVKMAQGAEKYGENNYALADSEEELVRFRSSAARHFAQWLAGETDEDHMAAAFFNMSAVAYMDWKLAHLDPPQGEIGPRDMGEVTWEDIAGRPAPFLSSYTDNGDGSLTQLDTLSAEESARAFWYDGLYDEDYGDAA